MERVKISFAGLLPSLSHWGGLLLFDEVKLSLMCRCTTFSSNFYHFLQWSGGSGWGEGSALLEFDYQQVIKRRRPGAVGHSHCLLFIQERVSSFHPVFNSHKLGYDQGCTKLNLWLELLLGWCDSDECKSHSHWLPEIVKHFCFLYRTLMHKLKNNDFEHEKGKSAGLFAIFTCSKAALFYLGPVSHWFFIYLEY